MTKLNCPNCKINTRFTIINKTKFKCEKCENEYRQCRSENCNNLVKFGFICEKCVGNGIKNGGAAAGAGILAIAGVAYKTYRRMKK